MKEPNVDILIISSSRPEVLEYCLQSFNQRLLNCKKRFIINEDVVHPEKTMLIDKVVDKLGLTSITTIKRNVKPKGPYIPILEFAVTCATPYFFIVEDDWELEEDIRVDDLFNIMNKYQHICEIILKYKDKSAAGGAPINDFGYELSLYATPLASPGLWRTSRLRDSHNNSTIHKLVYETAFHILRIPVLLPNFYARINLKSTPYHQIKWLTDDIGAYGIVSSHNQVRHLGGTWKTFLPREAEELLQQELNALYIVRRTPHFMPDARPINGKIQYNKKFVDEQLVMMGDRVSEYIYYIGSLYKQGSLEVEQWQEFLKHHKII